MSSCVSSPLGDACSEYTRRQYQGCLDLLEGKRKCIIGNLLAKKKALRKEVFSKTNIAEKFDSKAERSMQHGEEKKKNIFAKREKKNSDNREINTKKTRKVRAATAAKPLAEESSKNWLKI